MVASKSAPPPGDKVKARLVIIALLGLFVLLFTCSLWRDRDPATPSTSTYRAAAQELVKQHLRDPSSAEFSEMRVIPPAGGKSAIVCGQVNARNGFGGVTGPQRFVVGGTVAFEDEIGAIAMSQLWAQFC